MENSNVKAKRPLRLIKNAAVIMLIFVFLIYFLPSDFTGSFFTDTDINTANEAIFTVDPFGNACFCVLTDFCGGKWLIVTISPQEGFDPNDLCGFTPNIVINGLYINEGPVYPLYDYWQLFWKWTGWFDFTGNLLGILPLGTPSIDFTNASFRLDLNIDGVNLVFLDSLNGGYYSGIGIYGGFDSYSGAGGSPDFSQFFDFSEYSDFGEFFSSNYGAPGGLALTGRPDRQSQSLMMAGADLIEKPAAGDEPEPEPEPSTAAYIDLSTLESADDGTGLIGIGGFDNIGGFFGFTPIPPEAEDEEEDKDDTGEEDKEDKEDEDPEDDITGDGDDISDGGDPGDGTQPPVPTDNPPEGDEIPPSPSIIPDTVIPETVNDNA